MVTGVHEGRNAFYDWQRHACFHMLRDNMNTRAVFSSRGFRTVTHALAVAGLLICASTLHADDWPQWLGPQRDGIWRETGIVEKFSEGGPKVRWRTPIGAGYAGPAVANGRVYVCDRIAGDPAQQKQDKAQRGMIPGSERVLCLNETDGKIIWKYEYECAYDMAYPAGPRPTPVVSQGKVYTQGAAGNLFCFDADKGAMLWSHNYKTEYDASTPTWGFSANPLLVGNKLICLTGGPKGVAAAFDKDTGKEIWRMLPAREPGYCPPMLYEFAGKKQLIIWHPESINSLDPDTGAVHWSVPFTVRSGLTISTPRKDGDLLFMTSFYNGPLMLRVSSVEGKPAATEVWRGTSNSEKNTDKLHSIICTPFIEDGYIYGVCSYGQLRCLKEDTGERVWATMDATTGGPEVRWATTFIVKNGNRFFLFNEKGDLIIAHLSPKGYEEISRAHVIEPVNREPGRMVVWSHPAFANKCAYIRNDKEIICVSLATTGPQL